MMMKATGVVVAIHDRGRSAMKGRVVRLARAIGSEGIIRPRLFAQDTEISVANFVTQGFNFAAIHFTAIPFLGVRPGACLALKRGSEGWGGVGI